jgi:hypothetical protein
MKALEKATSIIEPEWIGGRRPVFEPWLIPQEETLILRNATADTTSRSAAYKRKGSVRFKKTPCLSRFHSERPSEIKEAPTKVGASFVERLSSSHI